MTQRVVYVGKRAQTALTKERNRDEAMGKALLSMGKVVSMNRVKAIRDNPLVGRDSQTVVNYCYSDEELQERLNTEGVLTPETALEWAIEVEDLQMTQALNQRWGEDTDPQIAIHREWEEQKAAYAKTKQPKEKTMSENNNQSLEAQIAALRAENAALKSKKGEARKLSMKISEKGCISVYGNGRFPTSLYKGQWLRLLAFAPQIADFIAAHPELKDKDEEVANGTTPTPAA